MKTRSRFVANVATTMSGTAVAQAIPILISPILTRLYTPEEFGSFYLLMAIATILQVASTGRYELGIIGPSDNDKALSLLGTSLLFLGIFSITILILSVLLLTIAPPHWLDTAHGLNWLLLMPVYLISVGLYHVLYYWHNRHARFLALTKGKWLMAIVNAVGRIIAGLMHFGTFGLIVATLISQFCGAWYFYRIFSKTENKSLIKKNLNFKKTLREYSHFPRDMIPGGLFNVASVQSPNIIINLLFNAAAAGAYGFMNRILKLPLAVIAKSVEDVFKQRAMETIKKGESCTALVMKTIVYMFLVFVLPFTILFLYTTNLFDIVFGEDWVQAGELARIFLPPIFMHFVISPAFSIFYLSGNTRLFSRIQFIQLALVLLCFLCSRLIELQFMSTMYLLSGSYLVAHSCMFVALIWISHTPNAWKTDATSGD